MENRGKLEPEVIEATSQGRTTVAIKILCETRGIDLQQLGIDSSSPVSAHTTIAPDCPCKPLQLRSRFYQHE